MHYALHTNELATYRSPSYTYLSPLGGQIIPKTWFDLFMRFSPLAGRLALNRSKQKREETKTELLRAQIGKSSLRLRRGSRTSDL
jgi:hypothetical protein